MLTITHFSTVHPRYDTRVFLKECTSLAQDGYKVNLVVADGKPDEIKNGVNIISIPKAENKFERATKIQWEMLKRILKIKTDIYHFHDPELIFTGIILKILGKKVVFDIHEDTPGQILSKPYLNPFLLKIISKIYAILESRLNCYFDYLITVNESIRKRLEKHASKIEIVYNYPILTEFLNVKHDWPNKEKSICYVGGVTEIRGIESLIKAASLARVKLILAGRFNNQVFENKMKALPEWKNVEYLGEVSRSQMIQIFQRASLGMICFLPEPNHVNASPNKFFEYLSGGVPIVTSNFAHWEKFIQEYQIGVTFTPGDEKDMAKSIQSIINNDKYLAQASERAKKLCIEQHNWDNEYKKIKNVYTKITQ